MAYFNGKYLPKHKIAPEFRAELMSVFETGRPKKSRNSIFHSHWFQYILSIQQDWGPWVKNSLTHMSKASGYFRLSCILSSFFFIGIYWERSDLYRELDHELKTAWMSSRSTEGVDIISGGDVVTKTIALRYKHIKGWIEEQETIKVIEYLSSIKQLNWDLCISPLTNICE